MTELQLDTGWFRHHYIKNDGVKPEWSLINVRPIDFLECSIASCLGVCLWDYIIDNKMTTNNGNWLNPFFNIKVIYSAKKIRIIYNTIDSKYIKDFNKIANNCYILQHLTLEKEITANV